MTDENGSLTLINGSLDSTRNHLKLAIFQNHVDTINNVWTESSNFYYYTSCFLCTCCKDFNDSKSIPLLLVRSIAPLITTEVFSSPGVVSL